MCDREACTPNTRLLPVKGTYFFTLAAVSSLFAYLGLYMKEIGLTMAETGIIWGVMPFAGAIIRVGIGAFADKLQRHKSVLIFCSIASGVVHCFLLFVPHAPVPVLSVQLHFGISGTYIDSCPRITIFDSPLSYSNGTSDLSEELDVLHSQLMFNTSDCFLQCTSPSGSDVRVCLQQTDVQQDMLHSGCLLLGNKSEREYDLDLEVKQFVYHVDKSNNTLVESHQLYLSSYLVNDSTYASMTCQKPVELTCKGKCHTITDTHACSSQKAAAHDTSFGRTFWIFSMIFFVGQVAFAPIFSLIDAITYDFLGAERHKWGKQRLWGTIGHGVFALSSGFLMDLFSRGELKTDFTVAFVIFAIAEFLSAGMTSLYRVSDAVRCSHPAFKDIPTLLKRPDVLLLLVVVVIFGMYTGLIETFLFIHLETLGQPPLTLFGLSIVANCVPQMVMFFFSGTVIEKIGHVNCVCLACAAFAVRMSAYSILRSPWMVLFVEPLHAITFGLFYATVSAYGSLITPKGLHGTIQGIIGSLYFGIGRGIGSVEGGQMIEAYGTGQTFLIHGVSAASLLIAYVVVSKFCIKPREKAETGNGKGLRENDADRRRDGDQDLRKDCEGDNTAHMLDDAMPMSTEL